MAKRGASTELNHDNWDQEEDEEDPGTFKPLSGSELQNRVIRKAKRSLNTSSGNNSLSGSSPFAKFAGFSSASSPFGSLKKNADNSSPFSSLSKKIEEKPNGSSVEKEEKNKDNIDASKKTVYFGCSTASNSDEVKQARNFEYYRQLQSLNESVLKWMQLHLAKNSCCDFTPVFNDYKKHMDTLNVTYPVRKKEFADFKFGDALKKEKEDSKSSNKLSNSSGSVTSHKASLKEQQQQEDESNYGAHFSSNTTNTSTFSFGCKLNPTATSSVSPTGPTSSSSHEEKNEEKQEEKKQFSAGFFSKPFQSSSDKPFSFAAAPVQKSSDSGEPEEYVPPKNDFVAVTEEDAFYTKRCKLFFKKGESYAEKGVGTLYLKKLEDKTQLLIRADTSLGNILLNIMLSASLPLSRTGKNNVLLVCIPNPPVDTKNPDSKEAIPILIRVKSADDADGLLEILNKHKS